MELTRAVRRSALQERILLRLAGAPARTITALADDLNASRPSVSRSLRSLRQQELVHRGKVGWELTHAGKAEAQRISAELMKAGKRLRSVTTQSLAPFRRDLLDDRSVSIAGLAAKQIADMVRPFDWVAQSGLHQVVESITRDFAPFKQYEDLIGRLSHRELIGAVQPLLEAEERNASLLWEAMTSLHLAPYEQFAKHNNLLLSSAVDNVLAIRQVDLAQLAERLTGTVDLSWAPAQLTAVSESFASLYREQIERLARTIQPPSFDVAVARLSVPAATVSYYTNSVRSLVEAETGEDLSPLASIGAVEAGDEFLDELLMELDPDFVEMRRGSWHALNAGGPDRLRHAGASQRELLRQVLRYFVPDFELPKESRGGPQIKPRLKTVLHRSKSDAEFVDAVTKALVIYYEQLNKFTHENEKHEESLRALLRTGEGLLRFILANTSACR